MLSKAFLKLTKLMVSCCRYSANCSIMFFRTKICSVHDRPIRNLAGSSCSCRSRGRHWRRTTQNTLTNMERRVMPIQGLGIIPVSCFLSFSTVLFQPLFIVLPTAFLHEPIQLHIPLWLAQFWSDPIRASQFFSHQSTSMVFLGSTAHSSFLCVF